MSRLPLVVGAALRNAFTPASSFRIVVAFAMSALVTLAVAGPLAVQAQNADNADDQLAAVVEEEIANGPIGEAREQAEIDRGEAPDEADTDASGGDGGSGEPSDGTGEGPDEADGEIAAGFPGEAGSPVTAPLGAGGVDVVELPTTTEPGTPAKDPVVGPRAGDPTSANGASEADSSSGGSTDGTGDGSDSGDPGDANNTGDTGDTDGTDGGDPDTGDAQELDPNTVATGDATTDGAEPGDGAGDPGDGTGTDGGDAGNDGGTGDSGNADGTPVTGVDPDPGPTATIPPTPETTTTTMQDAPPVIGPVQVRLASGAVPLPLDGATLSGEVIISPQLDDGVSVVFTLDGVELTSGRSLVLDASALEPGEHQLLVTAESPGGLVSDRIATFITEVHTDPVDPTDPATPADPNAGNGADGAGRNP